MRVVGSVPVEVNTSQAMPMPSQVRRKPAWYSATTSSGERPSASARTVIGVPCTSDPETIATWLPLARW